MISEKVVKALEEQIRIFKGPVGEEHQLTVKKYRDYLKSTGDRSAELRIGGERDT
jgi:hypothetical protein